MSNSKGGLQRKQMNMATNREEMRSKISCTKTLQRIMDVEMQLLGMTRPKKVLQGGVEVEIMPSPQPAVVASLNAVLNSCYKRLNKVLPDLKAIDSNHANELGIEGDEARPVMSMIELRHHIKHMLSGGGVDDIETPEPEEQPALPAPDELPDFLK